MSLFFSFSLYKVIDGYRPIRFIHISPLNLDKTRWQELNIYIYLYPVDYKRTSFIINKIYFLFKIRVFVPTSKPLLEYMDNGQERKQ